MSRRLGKVTLVVTAGRRSVTCYTGTFEHGPETSRSKIEKRRRTAGTAGTARLWTLAGRKKLSRKTKTKEQHWVSMWSLTVQ